MSAGEQETVHCALGAFLLWNRQGTSSQYQYCYLDLVIWYTICQLNQFNTNSEAAMLSTMKAPCERKELQRLQCRKYERRSTPPLIFVQGVDSTLAKLAPSHLTWDDTQGWIQCRLLSRWAGIFATGSLTHSELWATHSSPNPQLAAYSSHRRACEHLDLFLHCENTPSVLSISIPKIVWWTQICPDLARNWQLSFSLRCPSLQSNL